MAAGTAVVPDRTPRKPPRSTAERGWKGAWPHVQLIGHQLRQIHHALAEAARVEVPCDPLHAVLGRADGSAATSADRARERAPMTASAPHLSPIWPEARTTPDAEKSRFPREAAGHRGPGRRWRGTAASGCRAGRLWGDRGSMTPCSITGRGGHRIGVATVPMLPAPWPHGFRQEPSGRSDGQTRFQHQPPQLLRPHT